MLKTIEIDWDIHKVIESERRGFVEPPYVALRRLLGLPEPALEQEESTAGLPWRDGGVEIPHGSKARMSYQRGRQVFEGEFLNGKLHVNGREFDSLSAASNALAVTKGGSRTQLNGWNYWFVKLPGEDAWTPMKPLRDAVAARMMSESLRRTRSEKSD
jgi:hypothetical protein